MKIYSQSVFLASDVIFVFFYVLLGFVMLPVHTMFVLLFCFVCSFEMIVCIVLGWSACCFIDRIHTQ